MTTRILAMALTALSLLSASCGGADDAAETNAAATTSSTTTTAAPSATTTAPPPTEAPPTTTTTTTSTTTTTTIPLSELPAVGDELGAASGEGSLVTAGIYRSTVLAELRYEFGEDVAISVVDGGFEMIGPPAFAMLSHPTVFFAEFVGIPEPEDVAKHDHPTNPPLVPITSDSVLTDFFGGTPGLVLIDSGTGDNGSWWEFTADESAGDGYACPYGDNCFNIAFIDGQGYFIVGEEWTVRLWRFESDAGPVYAWLQASKDFPAGLDFGQGIVDAITVG